MSGGQILLSVNLLDEVSKLSRALCMGKCCSHDLEGLNDHLRWCLDVLNLPDIAFDDALCLHAAGQQCYLQLVLT